MTGKLNYHSDEFLTHLSSESFTICQLNIETKPKTVKQPKEYKERYLYCGYLLIFTWSICVKMHNILSEYLTSLLRINYRRIARKFRSEEALNSQLNQDADQPPFYFPQCIGNFVEYPDWESSSQVYTTFLNTKWRQWREFQQVNKINSLLLSVICIIVVNNIFIHSL